MASLYAQGWRQGTIIAAQLPLDSVTLGADGHPTRDHNEHDRWIIATQDCDLDATESDDNAATIELRAVFVDDPPPNWGLRSAKLRLTDADYVVSLGARTVVSAAVLTAVAGNERIDLSEQRRLAFKTWLGLRYDRPAVPPDLVDLAKRISTEISRRARRPTGLVVRDVLMTFDQSMQPPLFSLYAILADTEDREHVEHWLATIARNVPMELGSPAELRAAHASEISFQLVESAYAADVTQLTWRPNDPKPEGQL